MKSLISAALLAATLIAHAEKPSEVQTGQAFVCRAICNQRGLKSEWHENGPIEARGYAPREIFDRIVRLCDDNGQTYSYLSTPEIADVQTSIYRIRDEEKSGPKSMDEYPVDAFCGAE